MRALRRQPADHVLRVATRMVQLRVMFARHLRLACIGGTVDATISVAGRPRGRRAVGRKPHVRDGQAEGAKVAKAEDDRADQDQVGGVGGDQGRHGVEHVVAVCFVKVGHTAMKEGLGLVVDGRRDGCLQADQRGKRHPRLLGQGGEDRQGAQQRRPPGGCHRPAERQERLHVATSAQSHDQRAAGHRAGGGRRGRTSDGTGYVAPVAHNGLACCPSGSPTILGHAMALRGAASCRCHPLTPAGLEADIHPVDVRGASP
mmetsp:Transcript_6473/g.20795  ORF Transcript_6473/g.20795 Transcript_6473/m.20795 type:complete len:259 (-) Transcript_6473:61-837(-)